MPFPFSGWNYCHRLLMIPFFPSYPLSLFSTQQPKSCCSDLSQIMSLLCSEPSKGFTHHSEKIKSQSPCNNLEGFIDSNLISHCSFLSSSLLSHPGLLALSWAHSCLQVLIVTFLLPNYMSCARFVSIQSSQLALF